MRLTIISTYGTSVAMDMYYDKYRHFTRHTRQQIVALMGWLWAHCPKHRLFDPNHMAWPTFIRGIEGTHSKGRINQFRQGEAWTPNVYRGILDHYNKLGWPGYCLIVTHQDEIYIFKEDHLQGVLDVINNSEVGKQTSIWAPSGGD